MRPINTLLSLAGLSMLASCAIQRPMIYQYRLDPVPVTTPAPKHPTSVSLLVAEPDAVSGHQTEQMLYTQRPHEIRAFARNAWSGAPANMLYPLFIQGMQNSGYFHAVASTPSVSRADYRLDTQLIELQQNFIQKPSIIELSLSATLTRSEDNQVIASRLFYERIPCPQDTPYGGAVAANQAARQVTQALVHFAVQHVRKTPKPRPMDRNVGK